MHKICAALFSGAVLSLSAVFGQAPVTVESTPIAVDAFSTGTLSASESPMPVGLWTGASHETIYDLLLRAPKKPTTPAAGELMRRLLLTSAPGPAGDNTAIGGQKLIALANAGFVEDAITIASLSSTPRDNADVNQVGAIANLLAGEINNACGRSARLTGNQEAPFWVRLRAFCYLENDERDAADLTLSILREQSGMSALDDALFRALRTGAAPEKGIQVETPLQYAMARRSEVLFSPNVLTGANGAVLYAAASDSSHETSVRIDALQRAVAAGLAGGDALRSLFAAIEFDLDEFDELENTMRDRADDPAIDALAYQSIQAINAPEFARDKAKRIAEAIRLGETAHRAYALSLVYADDIAELEGTVVTPKEALVFASASSANGDTVGAARWLRATLGDAGGVTALPQDDAIEFITNLNLLSILDPAAAAQLAGAAGADIDPNGFSITSAQRANENQHADVAVVAAAFEAAVENLPGQAGLAALAATNGMAGGPELEDVIVGHALRVAGARDLERRYKFERAWFSLFVEQEKPDSAASTQGDAPSDDGGLTPRIKPRKNQ